MKISFQKPFSTRALARIEVLMVLATVLLLAVLALAGLYRAVKRVRRITCTNYLKQIGLAIRVWDSDHYGLYPMQVAGTNGGTMDFITGPNAFRHFQVMSNELSVPWILICPAESDPLRTKATNFAFFSNSNLSYFVGVDANETNSQMILSGDRNFTNGTLVKNGLFDLTTNRPAGWTSDIHHEIGNFCLADGSVQQLTLPDLREAVANTGLATNRLQMPITSL